MTMRLLASVAMALLLGTTGCSAAWRAAQAGQDALDRGDVEGALAHYASACKQSDDKDWCERADRLYLDVKMQLITEAQPVCGQRGQERKCVDILKRARQVKDDPQLAALADLAGGTWLEGCRSASVSSPVDALLRLRCLETMRDDVGTPSYQQQVDADRRQLASFATAQAQAAQKQNLSAITYGLFSLSQCFHAEVTPATAVDESRRALLTRLIVPASLAADGLLSKAQACAEVGQLSGARIACVDGGGEVGLRLSLSRSEMAHEWNDTVHDVTYVARREVYENPEWRRLDNYRLELERNARTADRNQRLATDNCTQAQSDHARAQYCEHCDAKRAHEQYCRYADTMRSLSDDADRDLRNVQSQLRRVDKQLVNEITDVYRYTRRQHTWRQNFRISFVGAGGGFEPKDFVVTLSRTGVEQPGFEPAGVDQRVAYPPRQGDLDEEGFAEMRSGLQPWLKDALERNAATKSTRCAQLTGDQAFECRAAVAFLRGYEPGKYYIAELGRSVDAVAKYPPAPCER